MSGNWQQSFSGKAFTPAKLEVDQVCFDDIPHALAQKVRFGGHCRVPGYTVAQHCVRGADEFFMRGQPFYALAFLLHEVSEVYLPDVPTPLKRSLWIEGTGFTDGYGWRDLERQHTRTVLKALELEALADVIELDKEIREMDVRQLLTEKRDLMSEEPKSWEIPGEPFPNRILTVWGYEQARDQFSQAFHRLGGVR